MDIWTAGPELSLIGFGLEADDNHVGIICSKYASRSNVDSHVKGVERVV
jgi:hypothetical protein